MLEEFLRRNNLPTPRHFTDDGVSGILMRRYPNVWGEAAPLTGLRYCANCGGQDVRPPYQQRQAHFSIYLFQLFKSPVWDALPHTTPYQWECHFMGRYIPPSLQPVPLTLEEQEELRKKEERKDRLHQNYLRRKANRRNGKNGTTPSTR